jgi:iron(III) transport system substrate-binding protein
MTARMLTAFVIMASGLFAACGGPRPDDVVVYVALDELYARPILDAFEQESGVRVRAVYDTEASKTTGLVTRLQAERARPRADVFWNNEVAQTIVLKQRGVLARYAPPQAQDYPRQYRDAEAYWTGFAARARVIVYNKDLVAAPPVSIRDLTKPEWRGRCAIAMPLFGTTATHAAALSALWGREATEAFFQALHDNQVAFLPGNGAVCDRVAQGEYAFGLTDTDDANGAIEDGRPVGWVLPDQEEGGIGTLLLPNSVALIAGAPNAAAGQKLINYLLSPAVEERLAASRSLQVPLGANAKRPGHVPAAASVKVMALGFDEIAAAMGPTAAWLKARFLQ